LNSGVDVMRKPMLVRVRRRAREDWAFCETDEAKSDGRVVCPDEAFRFFGGDRNESSELDVTLNSSLECVLIDMDGGGEAD
jgi:hypothetical protein